MRNLYTVIFMIAMLLCTAPILHAESDNNGFSHHRANMSGLLTSSDIWQLELGYHYMPFKYLGVGCSLGMWEQIMYDGWPHGSNWHISTSDEKFNNLYLRPSIVLQSPTIIKLGSVNIGLYAEPGIMVNIPYQRVSIDITDNYGRTAGYSHAGTSKGQWVAGDIRMGLYFQIYEVGISAGYVLSNFDIFSMPRYMSYDGVPFTKFYDNAPTMQGAFITMSYNF